MYENSLERKKSVLGVNGVDLEETLGRIGRKTEKFISLEDHEKEISARDRIIDTLQNHQIKLIKEEGE